MLKANMSQNPKQPMRYRLALDLGSTSLGWAMIRLNADNQPCAVVKAGVRIFSDGRNPKDGSSLAVTRREARAMRRRRDRLLKRKARMMQTLIAHGFFPKDEAARKELETLNPYVLRAKGLDEPLKPEEFARALFHINQRRGFKSNRKTDKKDNDSGALKTAINKLRLMLKETGCRTVGEWLNKRDLAGETVRARYRQNKVVKDDGKTRIDKSYDLYIDRAMIEAEFDALWTKQSELNPALFNETARYELKDCLLHQRPLKPVKPGRCTLLPDEERAPLALPSTQRFRIYQEVNNLRILREGLKEEPLTLQQRNELANALDQNSKCTFTQIKKLLGLGGAVQFNFEDPKRQEFKGNVTNAILRKGDHFGEAWMKFDEAKQDAIALQLVKEENEAKLVAWLQQETGIDEKRAEAIANVGLPEGYGSLSVKALVRILPELRRDVVTYDKAVLAAGFDHHSNISPAATGEILPELPYYGEPLQRHVGFGTGNPQDTPEKRYGKIANPTVHIGLNQVRLVVNALIKRYGHPSEVVVEIARDLKRSKELRDEDAKRQAENQRRNQRHRAAIAGILNCSEERVKGADLQKMVLWEELSFDPAFRRCPYSGVQISAAMLLSDEVEIEHILPFSQTLDDSLNNKTVALRQANRMKGNNTPWEAFGKQAQAGFDYQTILQRAELMPKSKRYRFAEDGLQRWLKEDNGFLARALNDTKHLSKVAREYVSLICPQNTRVIPGQMTAMLRGKFGLNDVLSLTGEKNRNDHRHHAVDACVIGVTDQGLLQRFAQASASARERQLNRLVDNMPLPWGTYEDKRYWKSVKNAVDNIWVSHKPDHSHEGGMFDATIYGLRGPGKVTYRQEIDGARNRPVLNREVVEFSDGKPQSLNGARHGTLTDGTAKAFMGLWSRSNYAIEIFLNEQGAWDSDVIERYRAYQIVSANGQGRLRHTTLSLGDRPLIMRLLIDDLVYSEIEGESYLLKVLKINSTGAITFVLHNETNVGARYIEKLAAQKNQKAGKLFDEGALNDNFFQKSISPASLRTFRARRVSVSPIGELRDPGFKE
jgi:CRISPR-associated endonuclease Csn1